MTQTPFQWFEVVPFLFSIAIKIGNNVFSKHIFNQIVKDIHEDYSLTRSQKETIADQAIDANQRLAYIIGFYATLVSVVTISAAKKAINSLVISIVFLVAIGMSTSFIFNAPLGSNRFNLRIFGINRQRGFWLNILFILFDILLLVITIFATS